ncbi:MAG: hypothetical protein V4634_07865 [Pseudomonadota bacterium]
MKSAGDAHPNEDPSRIDQVPVDFPSPAPDPASIGGFQAKLLMVEYQGQYYPQGASPHDRWVRWDACEDLVQQLKQKCIESKAGKRAHMAETEILGQYYDRLLATRWTSPAEARWIVRRIGHLLSWNVPASAHEP